MKLRIVFNFAIILPGEKVKHSLAPCKQQHCDCCYSVFHLILTLQNKSPNVTSFPAGRRSVAAAKIHFVSSCGIPNKQAYNVTSQCRFYFNIIPAISYEQHRTSFSWLAPFCCVLVRPTLVTLVYDQSKPPGLNLWTCSRLFSPGL